VADSSYLRFPRLAHNLLAFVAEDDVWLAPLDQASAGGARAWRSTSDRVPVAHPRLNPSGTHLAWTSTRTGADEAYAVAVDDGVALADETAGSDADMGANAFKRYGLGLENHGVDPDHEVPITPQDWAAGRDPQLETAVRLALEALERTPAISSPPLPRLRPETSSTQNAAHE
jgi:hypothetical protein